MQNKKLVKEVTINEVQISPIKPVNGLVAFASMVINESLYIGSIGVHKRLDGSGYRLTYPTKKIGDNQLNIYHPVSKKLARLIEQAVTVRCTKLWADEGTNHEQV